MWYNQIHWYGVVSLIISGFIFYLLNSVKGFKNSKIRKPSIIGWIGVVLETIYLSLFVFNMHKIAIYISFAVLLFALINVIIIFVAKDQPIHNTKWYKDLFKIIPRLGIWIYASMLIVNQIIVL